MYKKMKQTLEDFAQENGLKLDSQSETVYGVKDGYTVCLNSMGQTNQFNLAFSISRAGEPPVAKEFKQMVKEARGLGSCAVQRYKVNFYIRGGMTVKKTMERIRNALDSITELLRANRYENCCQSCGATEATAAYVLGGATAHLCPACYAAHSDQADFRQQAENQKRDHLLAGLVGALLGSVLGAAVIVLIGQLGYVAAISGVIIAVCTLKGYELLSGKLSRRGVVISVVLMLLMIYVGNRTDWAVSVASYYEVDILTAFQAIPYLLSQGYIEPGVFYGNLAMVYLFAVFGAVPSVISAVRRKKLANVTYKMGEES